MSDGRFTLSTEEQQAIFANRSAGEWLPYYEASRVANSFYAKQHGCWKLMFDVWLVSLTHAMHYDATTLSV